VQPIAKLWRHLTVMWTGTEADVDSDPETDAFGELYDQMWAPMVRLANLLTGSELAAEDVVQDAFIAYHRHADSVQNPRAYVRMSVVNFARSSQRRRARERGFRPHLVTVTNITDIDETWASLRRLPPRQRAALVLRFYEDLSEADVAALLGCPAGTVKSLVHRGLKKMKETIR
jgi:RNA polymerase sigma-70 factor (sigma-E family)